MKTLNYFKYFLLVIFGATMMFSCSDEEFSDDSIKSDSDQIQLRSGEDSWEDYDADCFVKFCVTIVANPDFPAFNDVTTVNVPGVGVWKVFSDGTVETPNGNFTYPGDTYCFSVPINGVQNVVYDFHGYGKTQITLKWPDECTETVFEAKWKGKSKAPLNISEEMEITCESPCDPPPTCFVNACITFIEGSANDDYTLILPTVGTVTIANGMVNINTTNTQQTFPLPPDGTVCVPLPVFDPVTATVIYNGTGSVVIQGTWEDDTTCTIFSVGECSSNFIHVTEEVTISCDPPCPKPECEIEACITFISGGPNDDYTLILPTVGSVTIANGLVSLPNGCVFPLPADGTVCTTLPIFAPTDADLIYNGSGSVEINVTYEDGTECTVFSAGVDSELNLHIAETLTLDCVAECPVIPDCYVNVCLDFDDTGNNFFKIAVLGVGNIKFINGQIQTPNGTFPNPGGQYCIDLPVIPGASTAELFYFEPNGTTGGSAVVTVTYPDLVECEVFSADLTKKMDFTLTCDAECVDPPEYCELKICAFFTPASATDIYQVTLPSGDQIKIQGGLVTLPGGSQIPYNGTDFCATIMVEVGTSETATLAFKGSGEVFTTVEYVGTGTVCTIFKAGQGIWIPIKKAKDVTLSCDPVC